MNIIPFGPRPPKKPKPKKIVLSDNNFAWISCDEELTQGTEIFSTDHNGEYGIPPDDTYITEDGFTFQTINGVIQ